MVDEEYVDRCALGAMARIAGMEVTLASSGAHALQLIGSPCSEIDVVIAKLATPSMSGIHLARRLRELSPQLAIVLQSEGLDCFDNILDCQATPLFKPFGPSTLRYVVQMALDRRGC